MNVWVGRPMSRIRWVSIAEVNVRASLSSSLRYECVRAQSSGLNVFVLAYDGLQTCPECPHLSLNGC